MNHLENVLRKRFPSTDIRSDQCDTIRMYSQDFAAGCTLRDGSYRASVISRREKELDDSLVATFLEATPEAIAARLATYFGG